MVKIDWQLVDAFTIELDEAVFPPRGIRVTSHRDLGTITRLKALNTPEEKAAFLRALLDRQGSWPIVSDNDEPAPPHVLREQRRRIAQRVGDMRWGEERVLDAANGDPVEEFLLQDYKRRGSPFYALPPNQSRSGRRKGQ